MFPAMIAAVLALKPRAFIVENVKGLLREQFSDYYQYLLLRLEFPERVIEKGETWVSHLRRLQKAKSAAPSARSELTYNVIPTLVNAANYGVPQKRERIFIVGFRSDLAIRWSFPNQTHSSGCTQARSGEDGNVLGAPWHVSRRRSDSEESSSR